MFMEGIKMFYLELWKFHDVVFPQKPTLLVSQYEQNILILAVHFEIHFVRIRKMFSK